MTRDYDNVAAFYDRLSRFIYGDAIVKTARFLAENIPEKSTVLVIGGGTGQLLEEISKKHAEGLQIVYVEISKKMIELSKTKNIGANKIVFINEAIQRVTFHHLFDVVITPFFLDNFSDATTAIIFNKVHQSLQPKGLLLFSDFRLGKKNNLWQKIMLKLMYLFFSLMCNIEASHLPDTASLFKKYNYKEVSEKTFFKDFICAIVYKKDA